MAWSSGGKLRSAISGLGGAGRERIGRSVLGASENLRENLIAFAGELLNCAPDQLTLEDGRVKQNLPHGQQPQEILLADLAARAADAARGPLVGKNIFTAPTSTVTSFCTQTAEVEVDQETGQVKVTKIVSVHDVGTVINPLTHQGQIEGGVIQGLGYALMEELTTELQRQIENKA